MLPLTILILSDERPGHYHLAEGVAAAIARRTPVTIERIRLQRRRPAPARVLAGTLKLGLSPEAVLHGGYRLHTPLPERTDLVISAGGDTLSANVAASRIYGAPNIFCGSLRHFPAEAFALVVSSYARHAQRPRHLVTLKPNGMDPDSLPADLRGHTFGPAEPPRIAGLLLGGPSGLFHWADDEWSALATFLTASHHSHGIRWIVSTSRRTPDRAADLFVDLAREAASPIAELIDFRTAGPGTLPRLFGSVEAILATEDSSTMLSEAVCARLPVVGVAPSRHAFKNEEREYRALLTSEGWCQSLPLAALTPDAFLSALAEVRPLAENHLDRLADALTERLPDLFRRND